MIEDEDIRRQLRLGEDSRWEFKQIEFSGNRPTSPRREDFADELCAFANADGALCYVGWPTTEQFRACRENRWWLWTTCWRRSAPTPLNRHYASTSITGNWTV